MEQSRNAHTVLVRSEGKRPLGRPRLRWEDNIKVDFKWVDCDATNWMDIAEAMNQW